MFLFLYTFDPALLSRFGSRYYVCYVHKDIRSSSGTGGNERSCTARSSKASEGVYRPKLFSFALMSTLQRSLLSRIESAV